MSDPGTTPIAEFGLKDRSEEQLLADLLDQNWTIEEQEKLRSAYEIVAQLHIPNKHRDLPYTYHLLRVANRIVSYMEVHDAELVTAALLHDVVEDHPDGILELLRPNEPVPADEHEQQQAALDVIANMFSDRTAETVRRVTNPPDLFKGATDEANLENYRQKVKKAIVTLDGFVVKFSDWCDNAVGIVHSDFEDGDSRLTHFKNKYGGETINIFEARFLQSDIQAYLSSAAKAYVRHQLELARERLNT